jgi:glycosyltransferase involved in cell wall biosynthesis
MTGFGAARFDDRPISVVMTLHNGANAIDRAISSLIQQTFRCWELVIVDDGSTDESRELAGAWARRDRRIKTVRHAERRGAGSARNIGLRRATSPTIAYLDCDDEYHPSYLDEVAQFRYRADVLIFGYESVLDRDGGSVDLDRGWAPVPVGGSPTRTGDFIVAPLGVAHSREPALLAGGFDENLWWDEHGDLWKRMARNGATFYCVPSKSGRHHFGEGNAGREPTILPHQRSRADKNFHAGRPLYHNGRRPRSASRASRRVVFASAHSVVDCSSGAAIATIDLMQSLNASGFDCQAFCTTRLDFHRDVCFEHIVAEMGEPYEIWPSVSGDRYARVMYTYRRGIPVTVVLPETSRQLARTPDEVVTVLQFYREFLESCRPDVLLTYGWDEVTAGMIALARRMDIPVVFAIHNFGYTGLRPFWNVDYCIVPSQFARRYYWESIGLACQALANPVNWDRVLAPNRDPRYVTFVNPSREKGVYAFARIAEELEHRRPDIPLLVVEGRATRDALAACWADACLPANTTVMSNTPDPRRFWGLTRMVMVPSLWWENQPAVAYEAMINGIPVVASDRGGTPETLGESGFLLPLPERLTPESEIIPAADEVEPWIETIIRLWDRASAYQTH